MSRLIAFLPLPLGFVVGLVTTWYTVAPKHLQGHFIRRGGYRFVQPLLDVEVAQDVERAVPHVKQKVQALINEEIQHGNITHVSVYFRDLSNGPWFGINEKEPYTPASLLKVPLLMAYLKQAQANPQLLAQHLAYTPPPHPLPTPTVRPSKSLEVGKPYPVEELLTRMIVYSDNEAMAALEAVLNKETLIKIHTDLGIPSPIDARPGTGLSVRDYGKFFRILFNATYLSPEMSEKALELLTKTEFRQGLVAGVPSRVPVAHKFGERVHGPTGTKQLHDCGIVYCPRRPYLLCVMTRGERFKELTGTIRDLSRLVYSDVCASP